MDERILRDKVRRLMMVDEWRIAIMEYLCRDFLKEQEAIIGKFCEKQENDEYKEAFRAKQSIEWLKEWIENVGNIALNNNTEESSYFWGGDR